MITDETLRAHRATWWVYAGRDRIRHTAAMRGTWGYDVTCSCGWETRTGGATRRSVSDDLWAHRFSAQVEAENAAASTAAAEHGEIVQVRRNSSSQDWARVDADPAPYHVDPASVPALNADYGWAKYRVVTA